mgnify:FL=1
MKNWLHYKACGLDNVWLANGFLVKKTKFGLAFSVEDIDGLHHLLACNLVEKSGLLTGKEFRFLRVHLGLTQQGVAKLLGGISENAVSLWERKDAVPTIYDHWLRMLVIAKLKGNTKVADAVNRIQTVERLLHQKYVVRDADGKRCIDLVKETETKHLAQAFV